MKKFFAIGARGMSLFLAACASTPNMPVAPATPLAPMTMEAPVSERSPADINQVSDGYRVETCGYSAGAKGTVTNSRTNDSISVVADPSGCIKTTFRDGRARSGDNLILDIGGKRSSETVPGGHGGGGGNSGGNGGGNTPPAPAPSLPPYDLQKARNAAENHARCTANAVVGLYGRLESFRYNFYRGFREGISLYNWSNMGQVRNTPEYQAGSSVGSREGAAAGLSAGRDKGNNDGNSRAARDVRARYEAVVDKGQPADTTMTVPNVNFPGLAADRPTRSIEQRVADLDTEYRSEVMRMRFDYEGDYYDWNVWRPEWSLTYYNNWTNYNFELVNSWYRDQWAWDLFRAGRFSRCNGERDYYNKISDSGSYSNASQAASTYRNSFKNVYDQVIDSKWRNAVMTSDPNAQNMGVRYGYRVSKEHARDLGYNNGYSIAYSEESAEGFGQTFEQSYSDRFGREVQKYESSVVPNLEQAQVVDARGERRFMVVGMPINVNLLRLVNLGRQPGEVTVQVTGEDVDSPVKKTVKLDPSATLKDSKRIDGLGYVARTVKADETSKVRISVNGQHIEDEFVNSWNILVQVFVTQTGGTAAAQSEYIYSQIASELKKRYHDPLVHTTNIYGNQKMDTLLKRAAQLASTMKPDQRAKFSPVVARLNTYMGKRPGFFSPGKKAKYDSIMEWLAKFK